MGTSYRLEKQAGFVGEENYKVEIFHSNKSDAFPRVLLSEPGGSLAQVLFYGAQVVSWKNERGEELRAEYLFRFHSEVRVEGLETLDYMDCLLQRERFTEQADANTFDGEVHHVYLSTPPKIAIIDHGKKGTFVLHKESLQDTVLWNPSDKVSKALPDFGMEDYKIMMLVDSTNFEKPMMF
ncbi:hypothetical protein AABB24_007674 [Solanum stoloniferum]|uniref:Glucose-6-phosphate 1-epimerase n=1 Tax=Solanum stoloniferum TaxID=62892 RepID=A0ABD2UR11_9SOLN